MPQAVPVCVFVPVCAKLSEHMCEPTRSHMHMDVCSGVFFVCLCVCVCVRLRPSDSHYLAGGRGRQLTNSQPRVARCLRRQQTDLHSHVKDAVVVAAACAASHCFQTQ